MSRQHALTPDPDRQASAPAAPSLDHVDHRLLALLAEDARLSVNELARRANVSRATAYTRFDRLKRSGVIRRFTIDADPAALGVGITALILANVDQHGWRQARDDVLELPGVEWVALTSGGFDFVLLVRVPDIAALRDVVLVRLQGLAAIRSTQTIFVLDEQRRSLTETATDLRQ